MGDMKLSERHLIRSLIREVLTGFGNKSAGKDGVAGNVYGGVPGSTVTADAHKGVLDADDEDQANVKKAACCLIVADDGKILAVSRKDNPSDLGLPGGKVDPGEEPEQAAARELKEETGLTALKLSPVYSATDAQGYVTTTFACEADGQIDTDESGVIRWVQPEELLNGQFADYNRELLKRLGKIR